MATFKRKFIDLLIPLALAFALGVATGESSARAEHAARGDPQRVSGHA